MTKKTFFYTALLTFFCLFSLYTLIWTISNYQINRFIKNQDQITQNQSFHFHYSAIKNLSWFPLIAKKISNLKLTLIDPSYSYQISLESQQAILHSSLLHPFTFTVALANNQSFCVNIRENQCFQLLSPTFKITFSYALFAHEIRLKITSLSMDFLTPSLSPYPSALLSLRNVQGELVLTKPKNSADNVFSANGSIGSILIQSSYKTLNKIDNFHSAFLIINDNTPHNPLVKMLVQDLSFQLTSLTFKTNGKLYFNKGTFSPVTGDLSLYISGLDQLIKQNLLSLKCCDTLKEKLLHLRIPSHITLPLSFREGEPYLGIFPLYFFQNEAVLELLSTYQN